jgi:hypothetical protein
MGLPEEVSGVTPQAACEPKNVAEGAAIAANFRKMAARHIHELYRSLREHLLFTGMKTKDCLSIGSEDFA